MKNKIRLNTLILEQQLKLVEAKQNKQKTKIKKEIERIVLIEKLIKKRKEILNLFHKEPNKIRMTSGAISKYLIEYFGASKVRNKSILPYIDEFLTYYKFTSSNYDGKTTWMGISPKYPNNVFKTVSQTGIVTYENSKNNSIFEKTQKLEKCPHCGNLTSIKPKEDSESKSL